MLVQMSIMNQKKGNISPANLSLRKQKLCVVEWDRVKNYKCKLDEKFLLIFHPLKKYKFTQSNIYQVMYKNSVKNDRFFFQNFLSTYLIICVQGILEKEFFHFVFCWISLFTKQKRKFEKKIVIRYPIFYTTYRTLKR